MAFRNTFKIFRGNNVQNNITRRGFSDTSRFSQIFIKEYPAGKTIDKKVPNSRWFSLVNYEENNPSSAGELRESTLIGDIKRGLRPKYSFYNNIESKKWQNTVELNRNSSVDYSFPIPVPISKSIFGNSKKYTKNTEKKTKQLPFKLKTPKWKNTFATLKSPMLNHDKNEMTAKSTRARIMSYSKRYYANPAKFPTARLVDPSLKEKCLDRKCRNLRIAPDAGSIECPKTPECNTPENRAKYCFRQRRDTYTCSTLPERKDAHCANRTECASKSRRDSGTGCNPDANCPRKPSRRGFSSSSLSFVSQIRNPAQQVEQFSTSSVVVDSAEELQKMYPDKTLLDDWEQIPTLIIRRKYNKRIESKNTNFRNGSIHKHFKRNCGVLAVPPGMQMKRLFSTINKNNRSIDRKEQKRDKLKCSEPPFFKTIVNNIIKYFQARPNCPNPNDYKKQQLLRKAEKAAKAAGLELCEHKPTVKSYHPTDKCVPNPNDPIQCKPDDKPVLPVECEKKQPCYKNPCTDKCYKSKTNVQKKSTCDKICMSGCKPPSDRDYCPIDGIHPACEVQRAPYESFSDTRRFEFSRPKLNECSLSADRLDKKKRDSAKFRDLPDGGKAPIPPDECKKFSTYSPNHFNIATESTSEQSRQLAGMASKDLGTKTSEHHQLN